MTRSDSRYSTVTRRAALSGALGAALLALAACSDDDSALAGSGSTPAAPSTSAGGAASSASPSAGASTSSAKAGSGATLPASASLAVSFTFAAATSSRGPMRNPYVAVWIEDGAGALVKTVALWHEDHGGQDRWLSEMKAFSVLGAADAETVSSATRQPGTYSVQWDGSTLEGGRAPAATYRLLIEAAREHGPYELLQTDLALGSKPASVDLTPSGELTAASAKYTA